MLSCFPDGNVALHKVGARASLIIACPKRRQRKLASAPELPAEQPGIKPNPQPWQSRSAGLAARACRGLTAGARRSCPAPAPSVAPPRTSPSPPKPALLSAPPEPTKKGAGSARQRRAGGVFLGVHREGGGGERTMTGAFGPHKKSGWLQTRLLCT